MENKEALQQLINSMTKEDLMNLIMGKMVDDKKEDEKKNSYIKEVVKGYSKETWLKNGLSIRYKVLLWDYLHMNIFAYWYKNK